MLLQFSKLPIEFAFKRLNKHAVQKVCGFLKRFAKSLDIRMQFKCIHRLAHRKLSVMAIRVVEFSNGGYKIKKQHTQRKLLHLKSWLNFNTNFIFDRSTCSKRSKESLFSWKNVVVNLLNFSLFHHVFNSSLDMFKNCINSYHIEVK